MKVTAILFALAATTFASAIPSASNLEARQDGAALAEVQGTLLKARGGTVNLLRSRQARAVDCGTACNTCSEAATTKATGDIGRCGDAQAGVSAVALGEVAILDASGYTACELAVLAQLQKADTACVGLA
ncbi:hypothetical protein GQ44DRAFT_829003 [Phaeosphaeriaceae sp. PMI808]|nr:hypothetical protein GQ44DRAFT_829003 [Phaeosphaeriaceae sp. PMI808]